MLVTLSARTRNDRHEFHGGSLDEKGGWVGSKNRSGLPWMNYRAGAANEFAARPRVAAGCSRSVACDGSRARSKNPTKNDVRKAAQLKG